MYNKCPFNPAKREQKAGYVLINSLIKSFSSRRENRIE